MEKTEDIITNEQLDKVWGNANFGTISKRKVIANGVLKCASGYYTGHTLKFIMKELGLVNPSKWALTKKGKEYLFAEFSGGESL